MVLAVARLDSDVAPLHSLALDDCGAFVNRAVGQLDGQVVDFAVEKLKAFDVELAPLRQDA